MSIGRGTTPKNTFIVPIDLRNAEVIYITYKQKDKTVIEKSINDIEVTEESLVVKLTQEDTLKFQEREVEIQIRARFADGEAVKSNIIKTTADKVLKEGVI